MEQRVVEKGCDNTPSSHEWTGFFSWNHSGETREPDEKCTSWSLGSFSCCAPSSSDPCLDDTLPVQKQPLLPAFVLLVMLAALFGFLWWWRIRKLELQLRAPQQLTVRRPRGRTDSLGQHSSTRRFFQQSLMTRSDSAIDRRNDDDIDFADTEGEHQPEQLLVDIERLAADNAKRFAYKGPAVSTISYKTMVPPPSWSEINQRLLQQDVVWKLYRTVSLNLGGKTATITLGEAAASSGRTDSVSTTNGTRRSSKDFTISVDEVGVHAKSPLQGGVLQIYVKESSRDEWREHTFRSAAAAAQFQVDLLALQLLGKPIYNMYQALELIHRGSDAYTGGPETVMHARACDPDNPPSTEPCGVAWDDLMRCLGTAFVSMQTRLDAIWCVHMNEGVVSGPSELRRKRSQTEEPVSTQGDAEDKPTDDPAATPLDDKSSLAPKYTGKRLMLGLVDFFRLFVPLLAETALPQSASSRLRMEQLLRWRKRVARASVLVQAYVRALWVANLGWTLDHKSTPVGYFQRRLAFDSDWDNIRCDVSAKNDYYEASVSRDVVCQVRGKESLRKFSLWRLGMYNESPPTSSYQGYSLVGVHSFQWIPNNDEYPLQPHKDPVLTIPSLRALVENNPEMDFFVHAFYKEGQQSAVIVKVFVRSLPKGVDERFDRVVDRFVQGDASLRKQKLECILQLGIDKDSLSFFGLFVLSLLSLLLRLFLSTRKMHVPQRSSVNDRTTIPSINLSQCGEVFHFGGALQVDECLPLNYLASATHASRKKNSLVIRMLVSYFESRSSSKDVVDYTYIFAGTKPDEVPERAVGTIRFVSSLIKAPALPIQFVTEDEAVIKKFPGVYHPTQSTGGELRLLFRIVIADPFLAALSAFYQAWFPRRREAVALNPLSLTPIARASTESNPVRRTPMVSSTDPFDQAVVELVQSLVDVMVPVREEQLLRTNRHLVDKYSAVTSSLNPIGTEELKKAASECGLVHVLLLQRIGADDIRRYLIASDCSLKGAAVRIVQSAAWRGLTFPIDTRMCRVELQNGQFFQQGHDLEGNPILYFRNLCLGRWRRDEEATIAAVLHRLESSMNILGQQDPRVRFTLIIIMGRPGHRTEGFTDQDAIESVISHEELSSVDVVTSKKDVEENNPRVYPGEKWHVHTSKRMLLQLLDIVMTHYPERLNKALVVLGHGNSYMRTALQGKLALTVAVRSRRTRERVRFISRYSDLQDYVDREVLVTLAGGSSTISPSVFEI